MILCMNSSLFSCGGGLSVCGRPSKKYCRRRMTLFFVMVIMTITGVIATIPPYGKWRDGHIRALAVQSERFRVEYDTNTDDGIIADTARNRLLMGRE